MFYSNTVAFSCESTSQRLTVTLCSGFPMSSSLDSPQIFQLQASCKQPWRLLRMPAAPHLRSDWEPLLAAL